MDGPSLPCTVLNFLPKCDIICKNGEKIDLQKSSIFFKPGAILRPEGHVLTFSDHLYSEYIKKR